LALGLLNPGAGDATAVQNRLSRLERQLPAREVWLSSWELLGGAIFTRAKANQWKVVGPVILLVPLSLGFAFRRRREVLLSLAAMC
jgi:hypothetical protein